MFIVYQGDGRTELISLPWFIVCCKCFIHLFSSVWGRSRQSFVTSARISHWL